MQLLILIECLHDISFLANLNILNLVSGPPLIIIYFQYPEMKHKVFYRSRFNRWNFISGDKCYVKIAPKWNHTKINICAWE